MTRYRIDTRRVPLKTFRTGMSLPAAFFAWLVTRVPTRMPSSSDTPSVDTINRFLVRKSQLSPEVLEELREHTPDIRALGFQGSLYHEIEDSQQQTSHHFATLLHTSGDTIARVKRRVCHANTPHKKTIFIELISRRDDGSFLITSSSKGDLEDPPNCHVQLMPRAPAEELWTEHRRRLNEPPWRGRIQYIADAQAAAAATEQLHGQIVAHLVSRRIFVPVEEPEPDIRARRPIDADRLPPETRQLVNEVRRQSEKKTTSPVSALLLLLVSIALFVALGGAAWSWTFALFLVPILLFHELGHFLCMKMFDYRNVNMFFIPLFGAAVSGHHYNVPGWKRVVTSLMGPVPGIFVGLGLGIIALVRGSELLLQGSIIMVIINGFNLIPALPLDGGWVVHGLLFSRHAFLDLIFRIGAIALLFFIAAVGGGRLLFIMGGAMLVGLPAAFHVARITDRLRAVERFPSVTDEAEIPPEAIVRISQELDQAFPKGIALKNKAKLTSQIFQNINSPPPGALGTLTLGGVYMGSLLTAVIGTFVLVLGQQADLGELIAQAAMGPQQFVDPAQVIRQPANLQPKEFHAPESLVASFADRAAAEQSLASLQGTLAPDRKIVLFGSTIVLPLEATDDPQQREKWFDMLESKTKTKHDGPMFGNGPVFVANEKRRGMLRITCIAPNADTAERIEKAMNGYIWSDSSFRLIPPWDQQFALEPQQQQARDTVAKINDNSWLADAEDDSSVFEQIADAQRRGRDDLVEKLTDQLKTQKQTRQLEHVRKLQNSPGEQYDSDILMAYEKVIAEPPANPAPSDDEEIFEDGISPTTYNWLRDLAPRLGQYPDGSPSVSAFQTSYGGVERNGLMLDIYLSFDSLPSGMLALIDWLSQQGCSTFKYSL